MPVDEDRVTRAFNEQNQKSENAAKSTVAASVVIPKDNSLNLTNHLLVCLAEECAEVIQAVSKALRFGLDDDYRAPDLPSPRVCIANEMNDLLAVVELLGENGVLEAPPDDARITAKRTKLTGMMEYARKQGTLASKPDGSALSGDSVRTDNSPASLPESGFESSSESISKEVK